MKLTDKEEEEEEEIRLCLHYITRDVLRQSSSIESG